MVVLGEFFLFLAEECKEQGRQNHRNMVKEIYVEKE